MWAVIVGNNGSFQFINLFLVITQYLLTQHACITTQNNEGNSPLHLAIIHSHMKCIQILSHEQKSLLLTQNKKHQIPLNILNSSECGISYSLSFIIRVING